MIEPVIINKLTIKEIPFKILRGNSLEIDDNLVLKIVTLHNFPNTI
jgi:hypothetical protein